MLKNIFLLFVAGIIAFACKVRVEESDVKAQNDSDPVRLHCVAQLEVEYTVGVTPRRYDKLWNAYSRVERFGIINAHKESVIEELQKKVAAYKKEYQRSIGAHAVKYFCRIQKFTQERL